MAVERIGLEVEIAEAVTVPAPRRWCVRRDAHAALPLNGLPCRRRVRLVDVVAEPVVIVFGAGVAVASGAAASRGSLRCAVAILEGELGWCSRKSAAVCASSGVHYATLSPASHSRLAAQPPDAPEPITIASNWSLSRVCT